MQGDALKGRVAVVAGATRGAGRAIAVELGAAGATVYATGRSTRGHPATGFRPETIEETADLIDARGGHGIAARVDHSVESQVKALFERVRAEQHGRLDILVNDIWGGHDIAEWSKPFWEQALEPGLGMQKRAVHTHMITSHYGAPLLAARGQGLIVEVTDGKGYGYRGNLFYSLAKVSVIHLAEAMAVDLRPFGVTALAVTPGFLRSEEMLDHFGVTEATWREAIKQDPHYAESETPYYLGRGVAALAADPRVGEKSGGTFASWDLAREYGFSDMDGRKPDWGAYFAKHLAGQSE